MQGNQDTLSTHRLIDLVNKFFDCLNGKSFDEGRRKKNPNLGPYTEEADERFNVS